MGGLTWPGLPPPPPRLRAIIHAASVLKLKENNYEAAEIEFLITASRLRRRAGAKVELRGNGIALRTN